MMYKENFVLGVKVGSNFVRENEVGNFILPWQSEYSIYLKNLADRKALVKVSIDGEDVLNGSSLIVNSNSYIDLERFVANSNRFKFIKMTDKIADNRGVRAEDGIIRVEWQFEQRVINFAPYIVTTDATSPYYYQPSYQTIYGKSSLIDSGIYANAYRGSNVGTYNSSYSNLSTVTNASSNTGTLTSASTGEAGFTTKGSVSSQSFTNGYIRTLENVKHSACMYLRGSDNVVLVDKSKKKCSICGDINKWNAKYCNGCGTYIG